MSIVNIGISPVFSHCQAHSHELWEIVLNLFGEGHMVIGDKEYPYKAGTIICQPPNIPHAKYCKSTFRDVYIVPSKFALSAVKYGEAVVFQDDAEKTFERLVLLANNIFHKKEKGHAEILNHLYGAMENLLLSWYDSSAETAEVENIKNKLINSFTNPDISIRKLLSEEAYSGDHLRRLFKQSAGLTPIEYLTKLRLDYAANLMRENGKLHYTVAEIAVMSGFDSIHYFSRTFKQNTGKSPSEYLRSPD